MTKTLLIAINNFFFTFTQKKKTYSSQILWEIKNNNLIYTCIKLV